ncbi:N-acetylmuramoyl-L-alanine amidase [Nocardiopsis potens]|uniref:N-acetylmuramoyl-L-alanine amidase n=1 Tax=Nocardiopsis potens TaxID=1246458 RepID=UPI0006860B44|nr:N-acetylmuramoyl-L-alanine amidase [Nocardiopsis potens]
MPRPKKYVSRSDLGWGPSPASGANPTKGLVIHYDSSETRLGEKAHSACTTYWNNTRDFHTGPSRGWVDIGYCVDEETEILTENGWRGFTEVSEGDLVLTLDHTTGLSRWRPLLAVNVFPAMHRELVRMEGSGHSSLTTPGHRWPVERWTGDALERRWATTESLDRGDRVPLGVPCSDLPDAPKYSDELVELVAWVSGGARTAGAEALLRWSEEKDPGGTARIRAALHGLFGPPCAPSPRPGGDPGTAPRWREARSGGLAEFRLSSGAERVLLEHTRDGAPKHGFLRALTRAQLALFIEVSRLGGEDRADGSAVIHRKDPAAAEAFQFAAVLAGHAASLHRVPLAAPAERGTWRVELHPQTRPAPRGSAFTVTREAYEGRIWCPTTPDGTWLARRAGTVYFTGNSFFACPHGYVFEGRGLKKTQAAQPGGNTTYYSCTLAGGPSEDPTSAQIEAVRQLRAWLMEQSVAGTVKGHRDFISTSCPGDKAYALVRNGTFSKPPGSGSLEDDMVGLREGDSGERVKFLQELLVKAGHSVGESGIDGDYGPDTSKAVLAARKAEGSRQDFGDRVTGAAAKQIMSQFIKAHL